MTTFISTCSHSIKSEIRRKCNKFRILPAAMGDCCPCGGSLQPHVRHISSSSSKDEQRRRILPPILVVGLGNHTLPGTRHNLGRMAINHIASEFISKGVPSDSSDWVKAKALEGIYISFRISSKSLEPFLPKSSTSKKRKSMVQHETSSDKPLEDTNTVVTNENKDNLANDNSTTIDDEEVSWERQAILFKPATYMNLNGIPILKATRLWQIPPERLLILHDDLDRELGKVSVKYGGSANGHNGVRSVISTQKVKEFTRIRLGISRPEKGIEDYVLQAFHPNESKIIKKQVFPQVAQRVSELAMNEVLYQQRKE